MRTFPDGRPMVWFLDYTSYTGRGPADFLVDGWAAVGVRVIARERARTLFELDLRGRTSDLVVWTGGGEFIPLTDPRNFVPHTSKSLYAPSWGNWYAGGGLHGREFPASGAFRAPPEGSPALEAMRLHDRARRSLDPAERIALFGRIWKIASDEVLDDRPQRAAPAAGGGGRRRRQRARRRGLGLQLRHTGQHGVGDVPLQDEVPTLPVRSSRADARSPSPASCRARAAVRPRRATP